jgi:hypothetical protein
MSYNIGEAQARLLATDFLTQNAEVQVQYDLMNSILDKYASDFLVELKNNYNEMGVAAGGNLVDKAEVEVYENARVIKLPYYYDFPNKGVKGWGSDRNAPTSDYQFKTKGMSDEGRQSIRTYLQSAKGKSKITKTEKSYGGVERKSKKISQNTNPLDKAVNRAVWMIKKYGIKTNPYFDKSYQSVFKDLDVTVVDVSAEVVAIMVKINLEDINNRTV